MTKAMTSYKNMFKGYEKLRVYEHRLIITPNLKGLLIGHKILHIV